MKELPISTTSYNWKPVAVPSGIYHIYAMIDDPLGAPAFDYAENPVTINDTTPPDVPTNVQVQPIEEGVTSISLQWDLVTSDDLAGYRVYYQEPNTGVTQVQDITIPDQQSTTLQGLYLSGDWHISVSAYDLSGNESEQSEAVVTQVDMGDTLDMNKVYLPIITRVDR